MKWITLRANYRKHSLLPRPVQLAWRALPHISQHLFISLGGIRASHVQVAGKSRSVFPKLRVFRTTSIAISFSSVICQCLIVL